MNEATKYWREVNRIKATLTAEIEAGKHPGQPASIETFDDETGETRREIPYLWIASLRSLINNTTAADASRGRGICMALLSIGAQRLADGSHRLATQAEIAEYEAFKKKQKVYFEAEDMKAKSRFELSLPVEVK